MQQNLLAVADGVGGWAESGVDPANYSRSLCNNINKCSTTKKYTYYDDDTKHIYTK